MFCKKSDTVLAILPKWLCNIWVVTQMDWYLSVLGFKKHILNTRNNSGKKMGASHFYLDSRCSKCEARSKVRATEHVSHERKCLALCSVANYDFAFWLLWKTARVSNTILGNWTEIGRCAHKYGNSMSFSSQVTYYKTFFNCEILLQCNIFGCLFLQYINCL